MSRTYRRKKYELESGINPRMPRNCGGLYAMREAKYTQTDGYYGFIYMGYRPPTDHEFYKEYYRIHGDSGGPNFWSPGKFFRRTRMRQNRMINKQELHKWIKNESYGPLFENNPRSCLWDWR